MKIVIITQGVSRILEPLRNSGHQIVGIVESMPRGELHSRNRSKTYNAIRFLYRNTIGCGNSLEGYCKKNSLPYTTISHLNQNVVANWVRAINPDIIVVYSMSQLLKKEIFETPRFGAINLHPAYLPKYRGPNPDFWHYYNMEEYHGVTVHRINSGEDLGDILVQEQLYIPLGMKSKERLDLLVGVVGSALLLSVLTKIKNGSINSIKQALESPTARARLISPDEHKSIIDWKNWRTERVWNLLRGTEEWLNALPRPFTRFPGGAWSIEEFETSVDLKVDPGTIVNLNGRKCVVTKDGCIFLKRKFSIKKFVQGIIE
jgi:methionyl-tRNA formyltransferase